MPEINMGLLIYDGGPTLGEFAPYIESGGGGRKPIVTDRPRYPPTPRFT